jgi:hypothetical protein
VLNIQDIFKKDLDKLIRGYSCSAANNQKESCGIITKDFDYIHCDNQHLEPNNYFAFNPGLIKGLKSEDILLVWHSHILESSPSFLSFQDLEACRGFGKSPDKYPYLVYHTLFNEWDFYDSMSPNPYLLSPYKPKPSKMALSDDPKRYDFYMGLPFVWGRTDCFGVIRHYFLGVLGLDIGDFRRPTEEEQKNFPGGDWINPWDYSKNNFELMPRGEDIRLHDVFEIAQNGGKESNHIAVVVDAVNMQILHSPGIITSNVSNVEFYGKHWQVRTTRHLRHKSLI